jgi:two-component system chemotaxis response regulator CheB
VSPSPIRVLVVDDSPTSRALLTALVRDDPGLQLAGEAADGARAVSLAVQLRPGVVLMDIVMPRLDGIEATARIMNVAPTPIVLASAHRDVRDVHVAFEGLGAGALALVRKPRGPHSADFEDDRRRLVEMLKLMADVKVVRRWDDHSPHSNQAARPPGPRGAPRPSHLEVVAMAASTGGPAAIHRVLGDLPDDFDVPVLVVQHIGSGFLGGFASWLETAGKRRVSVAAHGDPLEPGRVFVAPEGRHLGVLPSGRLVLSSDPPVHGFQPSATFLFESVARAFGPAAAGVILTGMGEDGVAGLRALKAAGGRVLAQDERSSIVFGMPGAAIAARVVDAVVPLPEMASRLAALAGGWTR